MKVALEIIIALGLVVFFHELGHFIVAKLRGVKVLKFSLGFGPKLIGVKKGDTDYVISALPFGGYVKMAGEDLTEGNLTGEKWEFFGQPWWSRILIVVLGPIMNFVLALITFILISWYGIRIPTYSTVIGNVEVGSTAEKSGFKPLDKIVSVDDKLVFCWYEFEKYIFEKSRVNVKILREGKEISIDSRINEKGITGLKLNKDLVVVSNVDKDSIAEVSGFKPFDRIISINGKSLSSQSEFKKLSLEKSSVVVKVLRGNKELKIKSYVSEKGIDGLEPNIPPVIDSVNPGSPAYKSGLKSGDIILAINNKPISQWLELQKAVLASEGKELNLKIKRGKDIIYRSITPVRDDILTKRFLIGVSPTAEFSYKERQNFIESIKTGFEKVYFLTILQLKGIYMIITNKISIKDSLGGPVMIVQAAASVAQKGLIDFLGFFGFINVSLGLINLFPIPLVDGGYILVFLIEGIRRKPLSVKYMQIFQQVGFVIIILIAIIVTYNDILRILNRLWSN